MVEALCYEPEGRGFDFRWRFWEFPLTSASRPHCDPRVDSASKRNKSQMYLLGSKGGRCVGLTTLPPSGADCLEIWELQPPVALRDCRGRLKCDGTRPETRFRLSAKRTSPFKSAGASFESTTGSRGVRISGGNAGYTMFRGSVKGTGYPLHLPFSPSLPTLTSPCATTFQLDSNNTCT